jgi:hypothetical protein
MSEGENAQAARNQPESLLSLALRVLRGEISESHAIEILKQSEKGDLSDA